VDAFGEGALAEPLAQVARAHPDLALGSYPFFSPEGYGANLVVRGRDEAQVEAVLTELEAALRAVGAERLSRVEG
jgi:molybdopterin-biosynthesis enzyme MoeA-like protein